MASFACSAAARASVGNLEESGVVDRDGRLLRQADQEVEVLLDERRRFAEPPDGHHPDDFVARSKRRDKEALPGLVRRALDLDAARVVRDVVDDLGLTGIGKSADYPHAKGDAAGPDLVGEIANGYVYVQLVAACICQVDRARIGPQEVPRACRDVVQYLVGLEGRRDLLPNFCESRHLRAASTRLAVQPRVLDRGADVRRERRQEPDVGLVEASFLGAALDADHADRLVFDDDRHAQIRLRLLAQPARADLVELGGTVEQQRLARAQDPRREALAVQDPVLGQPLAPLGVIRELDRAGGLVVKGEVDDVGGGEGFADLVADELDQRIAVELRRQRLADAVDRAQLGDALTHLFHQPDVLQSNAQVARKRGEQGHVRLAECMLAVQVLEGYDAPGLPTDQQGCEHDRFRRLAIYRSWLPVLNGHLGSALVDHQRLARLEHVFAHADDLHRLVGETHAALDGVREPDQVGLRVDQADINDLRIEDLLDLVAHEVVHLLGDGALGEAALDAVDDRQLRCATSRLVDQSRVLERDAEARSQRREEAQVRLGERVRVVEVLERDPAIDDVAHDQGCEQYGQGRFALGDGSDDAMFGVPGGHVVDQERLASLDSHKRKSTDRGRLIGEADAALDGVGVADRARVDVVEPDVDRLGVEDLVDLVADQLVHLLHVEL